MLVSRAGAACRTARRARSKEAVWAGIHVLGKAHNRSLASVGRSDLHSSQWPGLVRGRITSVSPELQTVLQGRRGIRRRNISTSTGRPQSAQPAHNVDEYEPSDMGHYSFSDADLRGPRPAHWYTGKAPIPGECPGVWADNGKMSSLPQLRLRGCSRQDVQDYFDNSWTLTELLFAALQGQEAFTRPPYHNLRHPLIFYYGHPAALYVNKLRVAGLLTEPINPYFESIFETGVDEMSWDDLSKNEMEWPSLGEVHAYRQTVYDMVSRVIREAPEEAITNITKDSPYWALPMGFEHERIHVETSSVLFRELPLPCVQQPEAWPDIHPSAYAPEAQRPQAGEHYPQNDLIPVEGGKVVLGKPDDFPSYAWDNAYGSRTYEVKPFKGQRFMVTNGEYLEFVRDSGYAREELWSEEGWQWRAFRNTKHPTFWVPEGPQGLGHFKLRTIFSEENMPWSWPVNVCYHEAVAFSAWKSMKEGGEPLRVESELEHNLMAASSGGDGGSNSSSSSSSHNSVEALGKVDPVLGTVGRMYDDAGANLNLSWGSESPVDALPPNPQGFHDIRGNAWEWGEDKFSALNGFKIHRLYEDFSTPCFDGEHNVILGGSFASTGDEASVFARFHFRPHFHQHSGFRLVQPSDSDSGKNTSCKDAPAPFVGSYPFASSDPNATVGGHPAEAERVVRDQLSLHYGDFAAPAAAAATAVVGGTAEESAWAPLQLASAYPRRVAAILNRHLQQQQTQGGDSTESRVLNVGCGPGAAAFELTKVATQVLAMDSSKALIDCATKLQGGGEVTFKRRTEGKLEEECTVRVAGGGVDPARVTFKQADPSCLPPNCVDFDGVLVHSSLDAMPSPSGLLARMGGVCGAVKKGGYLVIASSFDWNDQVTPEGGWLGGYYRESEGGGGEAVAVMSQEGIGEALGDEFELVEASDLPLAVQQSDRKFTYSLARAMTWRRKSS